MEIMLKILFLLNFLAIVASQFNGNRFPSESSCPAWNQFQVSRCFWPTMNYESLPGSCRNIINEPSLSPWLQLFFQSKNVEEYSVMQHDFQRRGNPSICGYCSRKYRCRTRTANSNNNRGIPIHCSRKEVEILNEQCPGTHPCMFEIQNGGCPPPLPIHAWVFKTTAPPPTPHGVFVGQNTVKKQHRTAKRSAGREGLLEATGENRKKRQTGNSFQGYPQPPLPYAEGNFNQGMIH